MHNFDFYKELRFILICSIFLDIAAFLVSIMFVGATLSMAVGLVMGTAVLALNLRLMYNSILKNVRFKSTVKNPMMNGYLLRSLISCIAIAIAIRLDFINALGVVIPLFYPKLIYTVHSVVKGGS